MCHCMLFCARWVHVSLPDVLCEVGACDIA